MKYVYYNTSNEFVIYKTLKQAKLAATKDKSGSGKKPEVWAKPFGLAIAILASRKEGNRWINRNYWSKK